MSCVDLHVHSNTSDGIPSPEQVVRLAHEVGLSAIVLTDHDTMVGVAGVTEARAELGLEVVSGIKVSSSLRDRETRILRLFVNIDSPSLQVALKGSRHHRNQRNQEMLGRFDVHDIHSATEDLCAGNLDTVVTRAHVARVLLAKGLGPDLDHIFKKYLQYGGACHPPKELLLPEAVMEALLDSHAFMVLAHPFQYKLGGKATEELTTCPASLGMEGPEVYYPSHNRLEGVKLQEAATRRHPLSTGGFSFHSSNRPDISMGTDRSGLRVFSLLLDAMKDTL